MRPPIPPPNRTEVQAVRTALEAAKHPLRTLPDISIDDAATLTALDSRLIERVRGYEDLQRLRSVGPSLAAKLMIAGYGCRADLAGGDPAAMYRDLCARLNRRVDPCVEDVFRCAVAQVRYPDMPDHYGDWWAWTAERGQPSVPRPEASK